MQGNFTVRFCIYLQLSWFIHSSPPLLHDNVLNTTLMVILNGPVHHRVVILDNRGDITGFFHVLNFAGRGIITIAYFESNT